MTSFCLLVRSDGKEADCRAMCGKSTCEARNQEECRTLAGELNLGLGGNGYSFAGDYGTDGCYTYTSGSYSKYVYFGYSGTDFKSVKSGQKRPSGKSICKTPVCECYGSSKCKNGKCSVGLSTSCANKEWDIWELSFVSPDPCKTTTTEPTPAPYDPNGEMNRNEWVSDTVKHFYLGEGCLKDGTWKEIFRSSMMGVAGFGADECFSGCIRRAYGECKIYSVKDGRCYVSSSPDFKPRTWTRGCQEDVYVPAPGWGIIGYHEGKPNIGDVWCQATTGWAVGKKESDVGSTSSIQACAEKVAKQVSGANGVKWKKDGGKCLGITGMKSIRPEHTSYKSCYFVVAAGRSGQGTIPLGYSCTWDWQCRGNLRCNEEDPYDWDGPKICQKPLGSEAFANAKSTPSNLWINGLAFFGFAAVVYGAGKFFCKQ